MEFLVYILFFVGFALLLKGGDWLVDGSSSLAKRFNISNLVIGLTIVAFGTSAPELVVNIIASIQGSTEIAIGNVIGSNISNILLVLGAAALILPLRISKSTAWKEIPFSLLATLAIFFIVNDFLINGLGPNEISRSDGLVLLSFFIIFIYYTFGIAKVTGEKPENYKEEKIGKSIIFIILGIICLTIGGKWVVDGAIAIATLFKLSEAFIGLTIVAIGTSLPEMVTSVAAAYKKNEDIAIGNIIGSNIFNLLWILGLSSVIRPIPFNSLLNYDIYYLIGITLLFFIFIFISRTRKFIFISKNYLIERWQGLLFIFLYIIYIISITYRG